MDTEHFSHLIGGGGGVLVDTERFFSSQLMQCGGRGVYQWSQIISDLMHSLLGGGGGVLMNTNTSVTHSWKGGGGGEVTGGHRTVIWLTLGWDGMGEVLLYIHTRPAFSSITSMYMTVAASLFQSEKILSFVPPDGHFRLMSYHIGSNKWVLKRKEKKKSTPCSC